MNITEFYVEESETVIGAMKRLDQVARKVLFVQNDGKLQAAITDGDIRRWILSKGDLNASVKRVANYHPLYLVNGNYEQAKRFLKENSIEAVPIVDDELMIKDIIFWDQRKISAPREQLNLPVVIMAGGKGTRLYPYTKILPKPLIPVGDLPIAEHIIKQFCAYGCNEFHLIVNHKKNMIKAYFNEIEKDYKVSYVDEEQPLGTGGGLSLLKGKIKGSFILTNCDILIQDSIAKVYKFHQENHNIITMICALKNFQIPYGVVNIGDGGVIESMKEKPDFSFFTNTGCYIVEPQVIEEMEEKAAGFPEIIEKYKNQGENVGVYPISENSWLDMGQMDELEKMREQLEK